MSNDVFTMETIRARHSVRSFTDQPIEGEVLAALQAEIESGNAKGNLHMTLVCDEAEAFDSAMAHYGKFSNVKNYLVIAGQAAADLEERAGYYGERVVLVAQALGLNSCWVGLTFKKRFVKRHLDRGDKLVIVVALGYGTTQGPSHDVKDAAEVGCGSDAPAWFTAGTEAALLAPTAMNQQKFCFEPAGERDGKPAIAVKNLGGFFSKVDLGIVKLHFEIGAGTDNFTWA